MFREIVSPGSQKRPVAGDVVADSQGTVYRVLSCGMKLINLEKLDDAAVRVQMYIRDIRPAAPAPKPESEKTRDQIIAEEFEN